MAAFSVQRTIVYSLAMFVGLAAGVTLVNSHWPFQTTMAFATAGALVIGVATGFVTREAKTEVAGATLASIDAAVGGAWSLRGFRARPADDGSVVYQRGLAALGDRFRVVSSATGVRLEGPANLIRFVKARAAG